MLYTVKIESHEQGFTITGPGMNRVAKNLREAELWVRANYWVNPQEFSDMRTSLELTGEASIERSASKLT